LERKTAIVIENCITLGHERLEGKDYRVGNKDINTRIEDLKFSRAINVTKYRGRSGVKAGLETSQSLEYCVAVSAVSVNAGHEPASTSNDVKLRVAK
jgi:hypothetical protein